MEVRKHLEKLSGERGILNWEKMMLLPSLRKENLAYTAARLRTQGWDSSLPVVRPCALRQAGSTVSGSVDKASLGRISITEREQKTGEIRAGVCVCLLKGKDVLFYSFEEITGGISSV